MKNKSSVSNEVFKCQCLGDFMTVEMDVKNVGTWLLHDSVNKQAEFGMETRYTVYSKKSGEQPPP